MALPATPSSYNQARDALYAKYDDGVRSGTIVPFLFPWVLLPAFIVFLYLLIPHRNSPLLKKARYAVWLIHTLASLWFIKNTSSRIFFGYGGGMFAWLILWSTVILLVHDVQEDFRRVERVPEREGSEALDGQGASSSSSLVREDVDSGQATKRRRMTGNHGHDNDAPPTSGAADAMDMPTMAQRPYRWVGFHDTTSLGHRIDWVHDLFTQLRGIGWTFQLRGLPPLPPHVRISLGEAVDQDDPKQQRRRILDSYRTTSILDSRTLVRTSALAVIRNYLVIDLIKTLVTHDAYFWGLPHTASNPIPAPAFFPALVRNSAVLTKVYRQCLSMYVISCTLKSLHALMSVLGVGLLCARRMGVRGEAWQYPTLFGSFGNVFDQGLAGLWGRWWHQSFRYAFEAIPSAIADKAGLGRSVATAFFKSAAAFALSGFLHASASYGQLGPTRPVAGPLAFFLLQSVGIAVQLSLAAVLARMDWKRRAMDLGAPRGAVEVVRRAGNYAFVHFWLYFTASLFVDDFVAGGIVFTEIWPVSLFRGLGLGGAGLGWWCWGGGGEGGGEWVRWHRGETFWTTGWAA